MSEAVELVNARIFKHMGHRESEVHVKHQGTLSTETEIDISKGETRCVCGASMKSEAGQRICPRAEYIHIDVHRSEVQSLVNNFSGMKNGAKIRKKVNQIYGRQLGDLAKDAKKELDAEIARRLAHFNGMVKTKPRWVPTWAWKILLDIVLKSDTMV